MAKKKSYGIYIIAGIVIILVAAIVYYSGGTIGQAIRKSESQTIFCYFDGATTEQWCKDMRWGTQCSGVGSCSFRIRQDKGANFNVGSSCGSGHDVRMDGRNRDLHYNCAPAPVKIEEKGTAQCDNLKRTSTELKNKIAEAKQKIDKLTQEIQKLTQDIQSLESMLLENEGKVATACALPVCGNSIQEPGEECDSADTTKCTATCKKIVPTVTLSDDQVWHVYQCAAPGSLLQGPPGCPSNAPTVDHDLGYMLKQSTAGTGVIAQCVHQYGSYYIVPPGITTETDITLNSNCGPDDRVLLTPGSQGVSVQKRIGGYVFLTQQPGTRQAYKCVKSGTSLRYNYRVSFSSNCNAGQSGWDGYSNAGTLGYWLTQPVLPVGIQ